MEAAMAERTFKENSSYLAVMLTQRFQYLPPWITSPQQVGRLGVVPTTFLVDVLVPGRKVSTGMTARRLAISEGVQHDSQAFSIFVRCI